MAVALKDFNFIIRIQTIKQHYKNGLDDLFSFMKKMTFPSSDYMVEIDGEIINITSANMIIHCYLLQDLTNGGLDFDCKGPYTDFCCIYKVGLDLPCDWIGLDLEKKKAWLKI